MDGARGITSGAYLRAEIADPYTIVPGDLDADAVAVQEFAKVKFLTAIRDGVFAGFVWGEEQDGTEICRGSNDAQLRFEELLFDVEVGGGAPQQAGANVFAGSRLRG